MTCSSGDDNSRDAIQIPQITFLVRPMLHHERDFMGWTITAYLSHTNTNSRLDMMNISHMNSSIVSAIFYKFSVVFF